MNTHGYRLRSFPVLALLVSLPLLSIPAVSGQAAARGGVAAGETVFRAEAQNVVVDVVVTDRSGKFRAGLHKEDFEVREQGRLQQIASFEEHSADTAPTKAPAHAKPIQPGVFTNEPAAPMSDVVNVLLLDSLNTAVSDQSYVHAQAMKYLKNMTPGTRIAVFTLSTQLRFVQGFTSDASKLSAALNRSDALPDKSPLLSTPGEVDAQVDQVSQLKSLILHDPSISASLQALQQFQAENAGSQGLVRITLTYQALQDLARYLSAVPGRKNVIWFAGSFPVNISADAKSFEDSPDMSKTTNALATARVALYPVRAGGVTTDSLYEAGTRMAGVTNREDARGFQRSSLQQDSVIRATFSGIAGQLADNTGGEAFYGTNNLAAAVSQVIERGGRYYTITYSPIDKRIDGRYRKIDVKVPDGRYRLEYRRGYFADSAKTIRQAAKERATSDPLMSLMDPGLPDLTRILFKVRVMPSNPQPPVSASTSPSLRDPQTGKSVSADGRTSDTKPRDSTRYSADFAISMPDVRLEITPDGRRNGKLEVMLVAYDGKGKALNWAVQNTDLAMLPEYYKSLKDAGIQLHHEIDVPGGTLNLRVGVFDPNSSKAGTLEISLEQVAAAATKPGAVANF